MGLRHSVEFQGELTLLMGNGILSLGSRRFVAGLHSRIEMLDHRLELGLQHFIAKCLRVADQNAFLSRFDIRHVLHLPKNILEVTGTPVNST